MKYIDTGPLFYGTFQQVARKDAFALSDYAFKLEVDKQKHIPLFKVD